MLKAGLLLLFGAVAISAVILVPPNRNLALGRRIHATSTCGEVNGQPIREMFCTIAAGVYSPNGQYSYSTSDDEQSTFRQAKMEKPSIIQGGQNCDFCEANTSYAHPASNMVDGTPSWWQSPPLSRGKQYNEINITIDLEQEFHVAYVWIQMSNSPRPGTWILERSTDYGVTYMPWQYFAGSPAECARRFGTASLRPILKDDSVICTHEFSRIHPMENGEIVINLLENRPGNENFSNTPVLQNFARATNVRIRLLKTKTFHGSLMDLNEDNDPTITRRYYYAIKEIFMGGRCVCNGHADTCDVLDVNRPRTWLCRCSHNTCGDNCDKCCPGFEQKKWKPASDGFEFRCEPCNCHYHSAECVYDEEIDKNNLSLDIHGKYSGGGHCLNCRHNTEGINCNKCVAGFYRPANKNWNETDVCQPCRCDPTKHNGKCAERTGKCECLPQFTGENCDQCAAGYYDPPTCKPCQCSINGTNGDQCLAIDDQCPCKENYAGNYCDKCAPGFTNMTAGCVTCNCDSQGSESAVCNGETGECDCKRNFGGKVCDTCNKGYFNYPSCEFCDCDPSGTEGEVCDIKTGQCLCKLGFAGKRCDTCDEHYYGYPNCKSCSCDAVGSKSAECHFKTGECPCHTNFTGRTCDKCAAGYYNYPKCLPCNCESSGSKGLTCDNDGQCYCHPNFVGKQCDKCKPNFFNYPICEECNCNPGGVTASFAGCDKVAPGELCTCKENVQGRTCNQCKPTFWDLQYYHPTGCIDCACNMTGVISLQNSCEQITGQCQCKRYVGGKKCDQCVDGFYELSTNNHVGCQPCDCDVGGSASQICNAVSGQCRCRPRVEGLKCTEPIKDHYFPTLWQMKYEAEDARLPNNEGVRFAIDSDQFPNFSWKGFTVFSPIQEQINFNIEIRRPSVYKMLLHYVNPTPVPIDVEISFTPIDATTNDYQQNATITLPVSDGPKTLQVNNTLKPFFLNPGRWKITLKTQKRLFLDYIVLLPAEYYEAPLIKEIVHRPCLASQDPEKLCIDLLYPPISYPFRTDVTQKELFSVLDDEDKPTIDLSLMNVDDLPPNIGSALLVETENRSKTVRVTLTVLKDKQYYAVLEYYNLQQFNAPIKVEIQQEDKTIAKGHVVLNKCPYATFCRELLTFEGRPLVLDLKRPEAYAFLTIQPNHRFGIVSFDLIYGSEWNNEYLRQAEVCIRVNDVCKGLQYLQPSNAIVTEAENGQNVNNSVSGDKLPFNIENAENVQLMSLDNVQSTVEISGVVPTAGQYVFMVHYYNPDNSVLKVDVMAQNDRFADVQFSYCPSVTGCRTIIFDKEIADPQFFIEDKYSLTFYYNNSQRGPIYIDSITAIPFHFYRENLLKPMPLYTSDKFFTECGENYFENKPGKTSEFCKEKIFSLTTEFNLAALQCDCDPRGSFDFCCDEYGGQCKCRTNIIGRQCNQCAPGHYDFPNCIKCKCGKHQYCDEKTGQCSCPRYVEGQYCDKCVSYGFGYDPLIGCQLCGCRPQGSHNGELRCDPNNGQCLCKANVGGRQCDRCLPGFYNFPHCYPCQCNHDGTTEAICDENTAQCICKKNVGGAACNTCLAGTFFLRDSDPDGCSNCFCFGVTDRCTSSNLPVNMVTFDDQSWSTDDQYGNVSGFRGIVTYRPDPSHSAENVYLLQKTNNEDYTTSYGLKVSFLVASFKGKNSRISANADLQLISNNTILEHWASEQPHDPAKRFEVNVKLLPEFWLLSTGEPATRTHLMTVLRKLEAIAVKISYYEKPSKAILEQFEIEVAGQNRFESPVVATSVEQCHCPPSYTGHSCQLCAPGYYRVKSDNLLGSCVPCNCYGHSGTCDPDTGICMDCQHNTEGEHCENCVEGFYGNATTGSPYACLACACPYATRTNNFAVSCQVSEAGILQSCECRRGFSGDRCDSCDVGFFGNPLSLGGTCEPCFCNNNNNLTQDGTCNPRTGDCAECQGNTDGRHCEICKQWYYGDAIAAKNCTECTCNQCGSYECDNFEGKCKCQPYVEGENCDKCVADAWGFDSCQGCRMCECGFASSNSQCDSKTGQCACMPGADGLRCERCKHGFWNYGSEGCKKCDCEADLSLGTVCDIKTGQCHCQEGATGPRCDTCVDGFLRIPTLGCRKCDECVFALNNEIDGLNITTEALQTQLSNVSSVVLAGARLNKIKKNLELYDPQLQMIIASKNEDSEINQLSNEIERVLSNASSIDRQTVSLEEQVHALTNSLKNATIVVESLHKDARDLVSTSNWVIQGIQNMITAFETRSLTQNKEERIKEGEKLLEKLRNNTLDSFVQKVENDAELAKNLLEKFDEFKKIAAVQDDKVVELRQKLKNITELNTEFVKELEKVKRLSVNADRLVKKLLIFPLNALITGIEKDVSSTEEMLKNHEIQSANIADLSTHLRDMYETIQSELPTLEQNIEQAKIYIAGNARRKRETTKDSQTILEELKKIEEKGQRFLGIYDAARLEAKGLVDATHLYEDLLQSLSNARNLTTHAVAAAHEAGNDAQGCSEDAKLFAETSQQLVNNITELMNVEIPSIIDLKTKTDSRLATLNSSLSQLAVVLNDANESLQQKKELEIIANEAQKTEEKMVEVDKTIEELKPKIEELKNRTNVLTEGREEYERAILNSDRQLSEAVKEIPKVDVRIKALNSSLINLSDKITGFKHRISLLKEKIALARDKTNLIKLSAHFQPQSHLELPLSQLNNDVSLYSDIRFFFRTWLESGMLLYLGNEARSGTAEFIGFEIQQKQPKFTFDFGRGATSSILPINVNDNQWREIIVRRAGRHAIFAISKPMNDEMESEKVIESNGGNSVLNLRPDSHRLFLGGFPEGFSASAAISSKTFTGDIDTLRINGILIGLWNGVKTSQVLGAPRRPLFAYESVEESAVSFDGDGYLQIAVGEWNLRKRTTILLSFMTYQPDGLLFFVGKDHDQLIVEITGGRIKLSFDLGSGVGQLTSVGDTYNDGKWHILHINRVERKAKLEVDGKDVVEGESPGTMFEMSISDSIYLGGLPQSVKARFSIQPFRGCLKNLKIDSEYANFNSATAAKGIQPSCPFTLVRTASMISERARMSIDKLTAKESLDLSLRFRTKQTLAHIVTVLSPDNENLFELVYDNGKIIAKVNGDDEQLLVPLNDGNDGNWHYVNAVRSGTSLIVSVDDRAKKNLVVSDIGDVLPNQDLRIVLGKNENEQSFIGCVADVVWNGQLTNFASYLLNEVKLTTCTMQASTTNKKVVEKNEEDTPIALPTLTYKESLGDFPVPTQSNPSKIALGSCALPITPYGQREDSTGYRFGIEKNSRLEFDQSPDIVDNNFVFSVQVHPVATNGFIFFVLNEKQTEFITVYLLDGYINFMFGQPNNFIHLVGNNSVLDNDWHTVRIEREGSAGSLFIDGIQEANNRTIGLDIIQIQPPIYIGGVPQGTVPIRSKIFANQVIRSEFGGCLRDFKINDKKFNNPNQEFGVIECSAIDETGMYFGKDGGYAILDSNFVFTNNYAIEMEIRPRTKNAVLLSVGVLEFATVQLVDGNVVFTVDIGNGNYNVSSSFKVSNAICDGHWHHVKITMKKNIITVSVDHRSTMNFIKKNKDVFGKDPLYLGGMPKDKTHRGITDSTPYIGCVRNVVFHQNAKTDGRSPYNLDELRTFGDVLKNGCPVN